MIRIARRRMRVFLLVFLACLMGGLAWDFSRSPVYEVHASLLTVAPPGGDQAEVPEADVQHVAIQRQRLLGRPLLEQVVRKLAEAEPGARVPDVNRIRSMLEVSMLPETNLVELRARGGDPALLSLVVNTWVEVYLEAREKEVEELNSRTVDVLRAQYESMGRKIEEKRAALNRFREENRILSTEREENQVLSRLKGLNESLNLANEERIKAKARLDAVEAAIARGETIVPEEDKRAYAQMVERAQELREQVAEMNRRYTREYIQRSPALKVIPEKLARLEAKIRKSRQAGQEFALASARQDYMAARQTAESLKRQLEEFKAEASEFTAKFSKYQALREDLASLEVHYRELEDRLVKMEIANRVRYPPLQVVEWAYPPAKPIWPLYWRDAGLVALAALVTALLAVWLVDFLKPVPRNNGRNSLGIAIYPANPALERGGEGAGLLLEEGGTQPLPAASPPELGVDRIARLLDNADPVARQLLVLLLSGLSPQEIVSLRASNIHLESGEVEVPGEPPRRIRLAPKVVAWFDREGRPWLAWAGNEGFGLEEIDARLQLAAVDAGLAGSERVDAETLRHTYLLYLVRQGVRLSELEEVVGAMPGRKLLELGRFSPPHAGRHLSEIDPVYPLFA